MTKPAPEVEQLVAALRADLPTDADRERVRARLLAAGVAVSASVTASSAAAAAAGGGGAAAGAAKAGLLSPLAGLSFAAKVTLVTTVVAVSVALPIATRLHETKAREARASTAAKGMRAPQHLLRVVPSVAPAASQPEPMAQLGAPSAADHVEDVAPAATLALPMRAPAAVPAQATARATLHTRTLQAAPTASTPPRTPVATDPAATASVANAAQAAANVMEADAPQATAVTDTPAVPAAAVGPAASVLRDEAELLDRALSALRAGDRTRAREALALHASRFAHGALERERQRILQRVEDAPANP